MTRIGVLSDTHSHDIPQEVFDDMRKVDMILHAGDICSLDVIKQLSDLTSVTAVSGNMDESTVKQALPSKLIIDVEDVHIGLYHGSGPPKRVIDFVQEMFKNDQVDAVVFGHSHIAFKEELNGVLYFNPGSPTDTICAPFLSYGILEVDGKNISGEIKKIES